MFTTKEGTTEQICSLSLNYDLDWALGNTFCSPGIVTSAISSWWFLPGQIKSNEGYENLAY